MMSTEKICTQIVLSIKEYCTKNGFNKAVLGLSGGVDSAVTAVLAVKALGRENVIAVSMPGPYSSEGSKTDAAALATNLGIQLRTVDINTIYTESIKALKHFFEGTGKNVAEENLQARIRANILFALSNKFGYLVLATGNKSEAMMGYGTLYGDLAGGLCPIGDLYKTTVYAVAAHLNKEKAVIPVNIITKAPSAELRPNQKDADELPEYDLLDKILKLHVEDGKSKEGVINAGFKQEIVEKIFAKIKNSEFKRKQAPPCVKVS